MRAMAMQGNSMMLPMLGQSSATTMKPRDTTTAGTTGSTGTTATSSTASTDSSSLASSTNDIGTTFLSLLVQELQNQDPTAPMDSTAMVGQMISLNQLDQLTSINQTLTDAYGGTATSGTTSSGTTAGGTTTGDGVSGSVRGTTNGQSVMGAGGVSGQSATGAATQAAMRLLQGGTPTSQPKVSTSVSLPASANFF